MCILVSVIMNEKIYAAVFRTTRQYQGQKKEEIYTFEIGCGDKNVLNARELKRGLDSRTTRRREKIKDAAVHLITSTITLLTKSMSSPKSKE